MSYYQILGFTMFLILGNDTLLAQRKPQKDTWTEDWNWVYDPSTTPALYQKGLMLQQQQDSLNKAWSIFSIIIKYDSISKEAQALRIQRDSLIGVRIKALTHDLKGEWAWLASGSNWGVGDSPEKCQCKRYLVADDSTFTFYRDGKPERSIGYHFQRQPTMIYLDFFVIALDNGEQWVLHFGDKPYWWSLRSVKNRSGRFLTINKEYRCVCGCPEETFIKKDE
jgi:hypothetical protein